MYDLYIDGNMDRSTPLNPIFITDIEEGLHTFEVVHQTAECRDQCGTYTQHAIVSSLNNSTDREVLALYI